MHRGFELLHLVPEPSVLVRARAAAEHHRSSVWRRELSAPYVHYTALALCGAAGTSVHCTVQSKQEAGGIRFPDSGAGMCRNSNHSTTYSTTCTVQSYQQSESKRPRGCPERSEREPESAGPLPDTGDTHHAQRYPLAHCPRPSEAPRLGP